MCFIIAVVLAIFAFNVLMAGNLSLGLLSIAGSGFFVVLMVRNILHVRKLRQDEGERRAGKAKEELLNKGKNP